MEQPTSLDSHIQQFSKLLDESVHIQTAEEAIEHMAKIDAVLTLILEHADVTLEKKLEVITLVRKTNDLIESLIAQFGKIRRPLP